MKYIIVFFIVVSAALRAFAQVPPSIELTLKESYERRLESARSRLHKGKYLGNVIKLLESCIKEKPGEVEVHLDLACAYAGKAQILAKAQIKRLQYTKDLENYQESAQEWSLAQNDESALLYGTATPVKPQPPRTSDDNVLMSKTPEAVTQGINFYAAAALRELDQARALLKKHEEDEATSLEMLSVEAWVKALLWRYPRALSVKCMPETMKAESIFADLEALYKKSSDKRILLILSDVYSYIAANNDFLSFNSYQYRMNLSYEKRPDFMNKSLHLLEDYIDKENKIDTLLRLRVSVLEQDRQALSMGKMAAAARTREQIQSDLAMGMEPLQAYANQKSNNAIIWYPLADKLNKNGESERSWKTVLRANQMAPGVFPEYRMHVPTALEWAIPTQIVIPDGATLLGGIISNKIRSSISNEDKLNAIGVGIECIKKLDEALAIQGISEPNKNLIGHARDRITMSVVIYLVGLARKDKNLSLPGYMISFLNSNRKEVHKVDQISSQLRRTGGDPQKTKMGGLN